MSEADKLWKEAMEAVVSRLESYPEEMLKPEANAGLKLSALIVRHMPRPAGWGEGGKDE